MRALSLQIRRRLQSKAIELVRNTDRSFEVTPEDIAVRFRKMVSFLRDVVWCHFAAPLWHVERVDTVQAGEIYEPFFLFLPRLLVRPI